MAAYLYNYIIRYRNGAKATLFNILTVQGRGCIITAYRGRTARTRRHGGKHVFCGRERNNMLRAAGGRADRHKIIRAAEKIEKLKHLKRICKNNS